MFLASLPVRAVRSPVPMSVRYDSLLVQCGIAALVYFVPQDALVAGLAVLSGRAYSNSYNRPANIEKASEAVEKFYAKKGLSADTFRVMGQSGRCWELEFVNKYK